MKKQHKTARGRPIDMDSIIKQHQETVAVSNSKVNARGDILDKNNQVLVPVEKLARMQQQITSPPVETKISETENITKRKKSAIKKPKEVGRVTKTDKDGNDITEVEYDDGSIEVIKEKNNDKNSAN